MNDTSLITFKAITNFVNELGGMYNEKHKPLRLYHHLINKTQIGHEQSILKHIDGFRKFCISNRDAILSKDVSKLEDSNITYSTRVYIDMSIVFSFADDEAKPVIWQHILCISALVDPAGKAKEVLRKNMEDGKSGKDETEFLTDIISKVENTVGDEATNPMDAVGSIMNSGILTDLIGGMQNGLQSGNLDLSKLLGAVQGMVGQMNDQAGDDPQAQQMMGMMNGMMGMMGNMAGGTDDQKMQAPDMGQMMTQMMGMMGQMQGQPDGPVPRPPTIKELDEEEHRSPEHK
jgi:hypothetical protein